MATDAPSRFEPPVSDDTGPYWDATRDQRLVLPWCTDCDRPFFYPRAVCPRCLGDAIEWRPASGRGRVHAASVQHKPGIPQLADRVPYTVALVELDEGVRMMSNVVGCEPDAVTVEMAVRVTWEPLGDGRHLPLFEPDPDPGR